MDRFRRIERAGGGGAFAHEQVLSRVLVRNIGPIALALGARASLGSPEPPHAEAEHHQRRYKSKPRRGEGRGAEKRHGDRILNRRRSGQSRHGEGGRAERDRRRHEPPRNRCRAKQLMRHRRDDEEGDEQADAPSVTIAPASTTASTARSWPRRSVMYFAIDVAEPEVLHQLAEQGAGSRIGKNCMTNCTALAMKVCVQCASNGSPANAAARIAAAGASKRMLQPR